MCAMLLQQVPVDSITGSVSKLMEEMESHMGDLMEANQPVANVIYDVLVNMGLPENAISIAMGKYHSMLVGYSQATNDDNQALASCAYCDLPAVALCPTPAGEHLACEYHLHEISAQLFPRKDKTKVIYGLFAG